MRLTILISIFLVIASVVSAQSSPVSTPVAGVGVEDVYLAKDNGSGKAGDAVSSFVTTDIPIYCVVQLTSTKAATVRMNFVAVSVSGVKPDSKVVTVSYVTKDGQNRVNFTGKPGDKWSPGKYRVDIFVDGNLARGVVFEIRSAESIATKAEYFHQKGVTKAKLTAKARKP